MKKRLLPILIVGLTVFTACGGNPSPASTAVPADDPAVQEAIDQAVQAVQEAVVEEVQQSEGDTAIQWTNEGIEKEVLYELDKKPGDTVTVAEANTIESISIGELDDVNMSDMQHLTGLKRLSINCDALDSISFLSQLPNLEDVSIDTQQLKAFDLNEQTPSIKRLVLYTYGMESLDGISKMEGLEDLTVTSDALTNISDLSGLTKLKTMEIHSNLLSNVDVDFTDMPLTVIQIESMSKPSLLFLSTLTPKKEVGPLSVGLMWHDVYDGSAYQGLSGEEEWDAMSGLTDEDCWLDAETLWRYRHELNQENAFGLSVTPFGGGGTLSVEKLPRCRADYEALVAQQGVPNQTVVTTVEAPSAVPKSWSDMAFIIGNYTIQLVPGDTLQKYIDMGFGAKKEKDLSEMIAPNATRSIDLFTGDGVYLTFEVKNPSDTLATDIKQCLVYKVELNKNDYKVVKEKGLLQAMEDGDLPVLCLPTPDKYIEKQLEIHSGESEYVLRPYISWDIDCYYIDDFCGYKDDGKVSGGLNTVIEPKGPVDSARVDINFSDNYQFSKLTFSYRP